MKGRLEKTNTVEEKSGLRRSLSPHLYQYTERGNASMSSVGSHLRALPQECFGAETNLGFLLSSETGGILIALLLQKEEG